MTWTKKNSVRSRFERPSAACHGALDGYRDERRRIFFERIAAKNDQVCKFADFNRAFQIFFVRGVSAIQRADANRLYHSDALFWSPDVAFHVRARDFRLERHHGNEL